MRLEKSTEISIMLSVPFLNKSFEIKVLVRKGTDNKKELIRRKEVHHRLLQRANADGHGQPGDHLPFGGVRDGRRMPLPDGRPEDEALAAHYGEVSGSGFPLAYG